jgi:Uma2 family endonuclease
MEAIQYDLVPVEDYLAAERESEVRHEYLAGLVYAMAGGSRNHNAIAGNIFVALRQSLRDRKCKPYMVDMRLRIQLPPGEIYYYPDVMVACDERDDDPHHIERPTVIFEVLSDSTERVDRREKRFAYAAIPSLTQYVLIAQDRVEVENLILGEGGSAQTLRALSDTLVLTALGCEIPVADIYDGVDFG